MSTVDGILDAVRQLSPEELVEFASRLSSWQGCEAWSEMSEERLLAHTRMNLTPDQGRRLTQLSGKSEQDTLTEQELAEYRGLAQSAERIDVSRVQALAELSRRRGKSIETVMQEIGWRRESA